jgi:hypothetical protein
VTPNPAYDQHMVSLANIVIYMLAVARITTLITHDQITLPARQWAIGRFDPYKRVHRWIVYLLGEPDGDATGCPWCVSIWIAFLMLPTLILWQYACMPVIALAASQVTGMIFKLGRT